MKDCLKCNKLVETWSEWKDTVSKYTFLVAVPQHFFNTLWRSASSGLTSKLFKHDVESNDLFYCKSCKTYFLQCPDCKKYIKSPLMPTKLSSVLTCDNCGKRVMYGIGSDYSF